METTVADSNNNNNSDTPEPPAPPTTSSDALKSLTTVTHPRDYYDRRYSALQFYKNQQEEEDTGQSSSPPPSPLPAKSPPPPIDNANITCQFCGEQCQDELELQNHLATHLGKKPFKCEVCGKRFRGRNNLQFHVKAAHGSSENNVASTSSNHDGQEQEEVEEEEEEGEINGGDEECFSPGTESEKDVGVVSQEDSSMIVEFPSLLPGHKFSIKNEVVMVTRLDAVSMSTGDKSSLYKCHLCSRIYRTMAKLQGHLCVHFENQCSLCDVFFQHQSQLIQHMRHQHHHDGTPSDDEEKSVSSASSQGEKHEYTCQFCSRSFDRLYSLHRHERVHTGFKPCYCSYCGKGFSESRNLRHHVIRYHSDGSQAHLLRRRSRHLSENNQRLKLVTPEMMKEETEELEPGELPKKVPRLEINEIRQQESLGEDVTVVIPSDAPIDAKEQTPKSSPSDNSSTPSEANMNEAEEIVSAPVKSILGWKPKRRPHRSTPESEHTNNSNGPLSPHGAEAPKPILPSALGLPFNPLNISGLSMAGLLPSPIISPLYGNLTSPPLLTNPLSLYTHFPGIPSVKADPSVTASQSIPVTTTPPASSSSPPNPNTASASSDEWRNRSSTSSDNGKGVSSLSRTHSRLYVVRQPIKREDACKPTMLPNGRMVYRCTYCHKEFCTVSDVNRHMDFHEDIRPYKCKFCDYYARTNSQLKVHMMRHQGIREFHCRLCSYKGVTQSDLNRHMKSQIHMMKARNECKHCGEGFVSPMNLEKHYHEKHFSQYEHITGTPSLPISSVREVPARKPRHECKLCSDGFMSPLELEKHYHDKHYSQYRQFLSQPAAVPH